MIHTVEVSIPCVASDVEILTTLLLDLGFDAFEEVPGILRAFMPEDRWTEALESETRAVASRLGMTSGVQIAFLAARDWNQIWEASLKPVCVGRFCIKPPWCETPPHADDLIVVEIQPKMSFGTGYHETTRLLLGFLPDVIEPGVTVLDAGTGTGILSIAAIKLGARSALGFDIDPWAGENAPENVVRNHVEEQVAIITGDIYAVDAGPFDVILANINLNVLLSLMPEFVDRLAVGGALLMSGVLTGDIATITEKADELDLRVTRDQTEGEWYAVVLKRKDRQIECQIA